MLIPPLMPSNVVDLRAYKLQKAIAARWPRPATPAPQGSAATVQASDCGPIP